MMVDLERRKLTMMRKSARGHGKVVPPYEILEVLLKECKMLCVGCNTPMVWSRKKSHTRVLTLQHDRDGTIRLLCMSCNVQHTAYPEDTFYQRDLRKKWCPTCREEIPRENFVRVVSRFDGLSGQCGKCDRAKQKRWRDSPKGRAYKLRTRRGL